MNLHTLILDKIRKQQSLSFAEFMQMALYDPCFGYYTVNLKQFGQDFTTAPELSPLFAQCLANQCVEVLRQLPHPHILEFGAGSGRLCVELLKHLEKLQSLPEVYFILELSGQLQIEQQQLINKEIPHLQSKIQWIQTWPKTSFEGVLLANEVLDAMPVQRFLQTEAGLFEIHIGITDDAQLCEVLKPCVQEKLEQHVKKVLPPNIIPYQSEVNLWITDWLRHCAAILARGMILIIDYGFPSAEYYHPDRQQGTLMCHHRHRTHTNPLIHIGEQDITAHVDFTHVAESALEAGLTVAGYTSQAAFLLANRLLDFVHTEDTVELFQRQQAVKTLTFPNEMGELFKVIALTQNWDEPLCGFQLQDRRASL